MVVPVDFSDPLCRIHGGRIDRQRQAPRGPVQGVVLPARGGHLPRDHLRRRFSHRDRLPGSLRPGTDRGRGMDALAADPVFLRYHQLAGWDVRRPGPPTADNWLGYRRPRTRRGRPPDLWISHLGDLRTGSSPLPVRLSAWRQAPFKDSTAAASTFSASGLSRSGRGCRCCFCSSFLSSFVQPNFWWLLGIMLLFSWMTLVDVVRAEFLRGRNLDYGQGGAHAGRRRPDHHVPARACPTQ